MSVFNKAGANPRLLFKVMVSPAAAMILWLGPGWKTDPDKGKGKAELMGFVIVSQSELPVADCGGFGGSAASAVACGGAGAGRALGFAHFGFFPLFNLRSTKWLWGFVPLCHITSSRAGTAK